MKKLFSLLMLAFVSLHAQNALPSLGQSTDADADADEPVVLYDQKAPIGPHHRRDAYVRAVTNNNQITLVTNYVTTLGGGMHYWEDSQWKKSKEVIELLPGGGAMAKYGQYRATFADNINTDGAVVLTLANGKRLRCHPLGLGYYDSASGKSVLLAEITDSVGELVGQNTILYRDCFSRIKADMRYVWRKGAFEAEVVLHEQPPSPADFDLSVDSTRLEVLSEFMDLPEVRVKSHVLKKEEDPAIRAQKLEPDLIDESADFGGFLMIPGKAFAETPDAAGKPAKEYTVAKRWLKQAGRDLLVEGAEYAAIEPVLRQFPKADSAKFKEKKQAAILRAVPGRRVAGNAPARKRIQMASVPRSPAGFVMDWTLVGTVSTINFLYGETYHVDSSVTVSQGSTFETGSVIKFKDSTTLFLGGTVTCFTGGPRTILTVYDDDTVGFVPADSTGNPGTTYISKAIYLLYYSASGTIIQNLAFRRASTAVEINTNYRFYTVRDCNFINCTTGVSAFNSYVTLQNLAFCNSEGAVTPYADRGGSSFSPTGLSLYDSCAFPPSVTVTQPGSGAIFSPGNSVLLTATATDATGTGPGGVAGGSVTRVDYYFYAYGGPVGSKIGTGSGANYTYTWPSVPPGAHTLKARAIDNDGRFTDSAPVSISVNQSPTATITSPVNGASFVAPATIAVQVMPSDPDGTIQRVDLYRNGALVGTVNSAPYTFTQSLGAGTYIFRATAVDNQFASGNSADVTVLVTAPQNQLPNVSLTSPGNGAAFSAPASVTLTATASDPDGTISKVEFFQSVGQVVTKIGETLTPAGGVYSFTWNNVTAGAYNLFARATDNANGQRDSSPAAAIFVNSPPGGNAKLLNFNFGGNYANNPQFQKTGAAAIGSSGDRWNDIPAASASTTGNLVWAAASDGNASGVTLALNNAPGVWDSMYTGDGMMDIYICQQYGVITLGVNGLPAGVYEVYLYAHGAANDQNVACGAYVGSTSYGTKTTGIYSYGSAVWAENTQYVKWTVLVGAGQALGLTASPVYGGSLMQTYATINGLQIRQYLGSPPALSSIPNLGTMEGTATAALPFTVNDPDTPASTLVVAASSSNQLLVPDANILLGGSGANRTVTLNPVLAKSGTATITLTVSDGANSATTSFVLTVLAQGDFNGDGKPDLAWHNKLTGENKIWLMNGQIKSSETTFPSLPNTGGALWQIAGQADFNGDGKLDILWQDLTTRQLAVWFMNGTTYASSLAISQAPPAGWTVAGAGDFSGDGKPDLVLQNVATSGLVIWTLTGANGVTFNQALPIIDSNGQPLSLPADYRVVAVGDFDKLSGGVSARKTDLFLRNDKQGLRAFWLLNGRVLASSVNYPNVDLDSDYVPVSVADFDSDGDADIVYRHRALGGNVAWIMNGTSFAAAAGCEVLYNCDWIGQFQEPRPSTLGVDDKSYVTATPIYVDPASSQITLNIAYKDKYNAEGLGPIVIQRRAQNESTWSPVANPPAPPAGQKTDNVTTGIRYNYRVFRTSENSSHTYYVHSGVNVLPVENRGRILVLVDEDRAVALQPKIDRLKQDLIGDGWNVEVNTGAKRHDDTVWANNISKIATNKAFIVNSFGATQQPPSPLKAVLLVGHVAVPRSGFDAADNHTASQSPPDHRGAWSADGYYGDIDSASWTDTQPTPPADVNPSFPEIVNYPMDGMFDNDTFPTALELAVGRIDFAKLPAIAKTETQMLNEYLDKDHNYRHKLLSWQSGQSAAEYEQAIGYAHPFNSQFSTVDPMLWTAVRLGHALFGDSTDKVVLGDHLLQKNHVYLIGCIAAPGFPQTLDSIDSTGLGLLNTVIRTSDFNNPALQPSAVLCFQKSSYHPDFNLRNNSFMRGMMTAPETCLVAMDKLGSFFQGEGLAMGDDIGTCWLRTSNEPMQYDFGVSDRSRYLAILGDPTLRLHIVAAPRNLRRAAPGSLELIWDAPLNESGVTYNIYRAGSMDGVFEKQNTQLISGTSYVFSSALSGVYMVRGVKLITSGTGSYYNMTQGAFYIL